MTIEILVELITIADIPELKSLSASGSAKLKRIDKDLRIVRDIAPSYKNFAYEYFEGLDFSEALPAIVKPDDNIGCWIMVSNPFIAASAMPANPPDITNCDYIATLDTPDRILKYHSYSLSDPPAVTDWQIIKEIHDIDANPTFAPDYQGQQVRDTSTGIIYIADGNAANSGSWLPTTKVKGAAIATAKTIALSDREKWFNVSEDVTITLPGNLGKPVNIELVIDVPGKTATLSPDGGTGATLIGTPAIADSAIIRNSGGVWYRL